MKVGDRVRFKKAVYGWGSDKYKVLVPFGWTGKICIKESDCGWSVALDSAEELTNTGGPLSGITISSDYIEKIS